MTTSTTGPDTAGCARAVAASGRGLYDCIQVNLALLADSAYGPGAGHRLGDDLVVAPRPGPDGPWTVEPDPAAQVASASAALGLRTADPDGTDVPRGGLPDAVAGGPLYVIGDAFEMVWLPYEGNTHMAHSFVVGPHPDSGSDALVVDAYDNRTEWGPAEPGTWRIPWSDLDVDLRAWAFTPAGLPVTGPPVVDRRDVGAYVGALRGHGDRERAWEQLTLDAWLLARRHRLFACRHETEPQLGPAAAELAERAERLAADAFVGMRRVRRGRAESTAVLDDCERLLSTPLPAVAGRRP